MTVSRICAVLALATGLIDLAGWAAGAPWLAAPAPVGLPTSPVAALMAAGLAAGVLLARRRRLAAGLGLAVGLLGLLRVADAIGGWRLGFDEALFHDALAARGALGAVGFDPMAALAMASGGLALAALAQPARAAALAGQALAGLALLVAGVALLGHAYHEPELYRLGHAVPMPLATAVVVAALAVALLGMRPRVGAVGLVMAGDLAGDAARRLLLGAVAAPFLLGAFWSWAAGMELLDAGGGVAMFVALTIMALALLALLLARRLARLAAALQRDRQALAAARQAAEAANRAKSDFLANMTHELRTPLNAIIGFSDLIADGGADPAELERHPEYAHYINAAGLRLLGTIDAILDMALVDAGRFPLLRRHVDVATAVAGAIGAVREAAERNAVTLIELIPADLPPIHADEQALRQVLVNLLSSAVAGTPPGGTVTVFGESAPAGPGRAGGVTLRVADTGVGMTAPEIALALNPFLATGALPERDTAGSGLALPLTKRLVELHGGRLEIESEPGAGTVVRAHFVG